MNTRGCGVLLHITSLPSQFGIGDLGPAAHDFIDFLSDAGQRYWQILPIHPTDAGYDNSPYHALSAFAGNPLLISPELMVSDGYLDPSDLAGAPAFPEGRVDYLSVIAWKETLFSVAFDRFMRRVPPSGFMEFCRKNEFWLDEYAIFMALRKRMHPLPRQEWPSELKSLTPDSREKVRKDESEEILREQFIQYLFAVQWQILRQTCHQRGIVLIGDIPIYVDYDSADVWTHPELFQLDQDYNPLFVAGVPPDYFSETGQVWGSPVYRWEELQKTGYSWWIARIENLISHVDYLRIDHFRGLVAYWEIPAGSETAVTGRWVDAPARDFLGCLARKFPYLPIIAEDLGVITPEVREIIHDFSIPGMKILLFAFGHDMPQNPYIIHHVPADCIVYTGTHDNNPIQGWYTQDTGQVERDNLARYLGREIDAGMINDALIRLAMMSGAKTVVIPMQDLLGLGSESRMNRPGVENGNWRWRVERSAWSGDLAWRMREMARIYDRI